MKKRKIIGLAMVLVSLLLLLSTCDLFEDTEEDIESLNFNGKHITLRSATRQELDNMNFDYPGNPEDFDIVAETVIDGNGASYVIALDSGDERDAVIKGLTITGNSAVTEPGYSDIYVDS